jgi:Zn finger protein HypA/HybF involved in hydrogenase expression
MRPGAMIVEKRPKARRACLNCDRKFVTTISVSLCPACSARVSDLLRSELVVNALVVRPLR